MATQDPSKFWEEQAKEFEWFSPWDKVLTTTCLHVHSAATTNIVYTAERHVASWRRNKLALLWEAKTASSAPDPRCPTVKAVTRSPMSCAYMGFKKATA